MATILTELIRQSAAHPAHERQRALVRTSLVAVAPRAQARWDERTRTVRR